MICFFGDTFLTDLIFFLRRGFRLKMLNEQYELLLVIFLYTCDYGRKFVYKIGRGLGTIHQI